MQINHLLSRSLYVLVTAILLVGTLVFIYNGDYNFILPFYILSTILFLGLFVLSRAPQNPLSLTFFALTVCIVTWSFAIFKYWISPDSGQALFWAIIANIGVAFLGPVFILFTEMFPREEAPSSIWMKSVWFWPALLLVIAVCFRLVIKDVVFTAQDHSVVPGPLFVVYNLFFIFCAGRGFLYLLKKYRVLTGIVKMQIKYVFLGTFLSTFFALITNALLPFLGNSSLIQIGPYFTVILVAFTSYAIVRHRLMSIEVVVQRSAVYAAATVMILAFYALAVIISETIFRRIMGYSSVVITALAAIVIAIVYQPLVHAFQELTDRLFFRGRYDYQKTLREISHEIASVIKLEELTRLITASFVETMKLSEISFLLSEREGEHFRSVAVNVPRYKLIEIDVASPIIFWLSYSKEISVRDEIEEEIGRLKSIGGEAGDRSKLLEQVRDEMERLNIPVWVPIVAQEKLIGIIALGEKLSGDIFTTEDLGLLNTLANQTAVALDNARLYNEVLSMKNYSEEILQSMTNGVLTTDNRGKIITFNFMAEYITGRKTAVVINKSCEEIWGARGTITQAVENTLKDRAYINFETSIASPERGLVPVSLSSTLLRDGQGKKLGALISLHDQSEIKELEDKVRRADKLSALATMAAGMAHEIKNPLSSMKVFAQLLPKKYDDPEYRQKLEEVLRREIDRIDRIVESLLGFTRATVPTFEIARITELLDKTIQDFEDQAERAGVKIIKLYSDLPEIEVDRNQISQAFSNFVLNAIQAMPEGGELSISASPGKKVEDIIQNVKIKFSDTGHGIAEDMQKKLFDPFFTTKYGGTGLGLTITHSIIDGHRGYIDVESKLGKGTAFTVTLPVRQGLV